MPPANTDYPIGLHHAFFTWLLLTDKLVACRPLSFQRHASELLFHEHKVGVVRGDCEYRNAVAGERADEGLKNPRLRKGKWAFELEANPTLIGSDAVRDILFKADDRQFIGIARDGKE